MFKIIRITALSCFLLMGYQAAAQFSLMKKYDSDTLQNALEQATSDSVRARLNYLLVNYWGVYDIPKAIPYLEEAAQLSKTYPFLLAAYPFYAGYVYWETDKEKSEALFLEAERTLSAYHTPEAFYLRAKALRNYALHQQERDDPEGYLDYMLKAIPLAVQSRDSSLIGLVNHDAGLAFMNGVRFDKAAEYLERAIAFAKDSSPDYETLAFMYANTAENYIFDKKYAKAKEKLDELEQLFAGLNKPIEEITFYMVKGMYYNKVKDYEKSMRVLDKGIALAIKKKEDYLLTGLYYKQYLNYRDQKDYKNALEVLQANIALLKAIPYSYAFGFRNKLRYYWDLSETHAGLGNMPQAYKWLKAYTALNDSVYEADLREKMGAMEVKFQTAEKERKINELEIARQKALLKEQAQRSTNRLLVLIISLLLITAAFFTYYFRNTKKQAQQQLKEAEQQQELKITHALLQGEERERKRVARDLHDGLGGMLAGIRMKLSGEVKEEFSSPREIDKVIGQLDNSITELRRIARNMMPEMLVRFGLEAALKDLCDSFTSKETRVDYEFYQIRDDIDPSRQIVIYRIIQELLSNALRHAEAENIYLQCSQNENIFLITVEDDGRGFDPTLVKDKKGIGLRNIQNRVDYLNGKMDVSSQPDEGTTINIEVDVAG